jgi:DNA-binding ferritin-like protein (Dps family)
MIRRVHHEEVSVNAITVRNLPPAVAKAVKERARKEKLSLNKAIVRLLEEATGAGKGKKRVVHHDLDRFFGTWTKEEADAFDEALREQRQIDPEMWG